MRLPTAPVASTNSAGGPPRRYSVRLGGRESVRVDVCPHEQLVRVKRFDDVVVCADEEPGHTIERLPARAGDKHERQAVTEPVAELVANLIAADSGECDVEDDESGLKAFGESKHLGAGGRFVRSGADPHEQRTDESTQLRVAVGDEDRHAAARISPQSTWIVSRTAVAGQGTLLLFRYDETDGIAGRKISKLRPF